MTFTDQLVKPFIGHTGETGDVVHVDQGIVGTQQHAVVAVIEVNMVRISSVRFMKVVRMRGKVLSRILRTVLQIRDSRDYRRGNGLPDRTHHDDRGRNH